MSTISDVDIKDMWPDVSDVNVHPWAKEKKLLVERDIEDVVNHPKHYTEHPSGVECIQITEHMSFLLGNAMKYIWRADLKNGSIAGAIEDLQKAVWYLNREIAKRNNSA